MSRYLITSSLFILGLIVGCSDQSSFEIIQDAGKGAISEGDAIGREGGNVGGVSDSIDGTEPSSSNDGAADGTGVEVISEEVLGEPVNKPKDPVEVAKLCEGATLLTKVLDIEFKDPAKVCAFDKGFNKARKDAYITAREEQHYDFALAADEVLCEMNFSFDKQAMRYDDEIVLLYNDVVLMSSSKDLVSHLEEKNGLSKYFWGNLVGEPYLPSTQDTGPYCLGEKDNLGSCKLPLTQMTGDIELSFDKSLAQKISLQTGVNVYVPPAPATSNFAPSGVVLASHNTTGSNNSCQEPTPPAPDPNKDYKEKQRGPGFSFVTTGDNDDSDCQHNDFKMKVMVKYSKIDK